MAQTCLQGTIHKNQKQLSSLYSCLAFFAVYPLSLASFFGGSNAVAFSVAGHSTMPPLAQKDVRGRGAKRKHTSDRDDVSVDDGAPEGADMASWIVRCEASSTTSNPRYSCGWPSLERHQQNLLLYRGWCGVGWCAVGFETLAAAMMKDHWVWVVFSTFAWFFQRLSNYGSCAL